MICRPFPVYWYRFIDGETEQTAFFGDVTWSVGNLLPALSGLSLNYGLRRFDYSKTTAGGVVMNGWGDGNFVQDPAVSSAEVSSKGWLFKYNVSYDFEASYMAYATVSKGYPGGRRERHPEPAAAVHDLCAGLGLEL